MKWFNVGAILKEIKKIRWPSKKDLLTNSVQVIIFTLFFGVFFAICVTAISALLQMMGVL